MDTSEGVSRKILCMHFIFHTQYKTHSIWLDSLQKSLYFLLPKEKDMQYNILYLAFNFQLYKDILKLRDMNMQCNV
jgi:hypothetical protein